MPKRTDRVFHLTVTLFALTLCAISAGTLLYQHNPAAFDQWLSRVTGTAIQPDTPGRQQTNVGNSTVRPQTSSAGSANDGASLKPSYSPSASRRLVEVIPYAKDVPAATTSSVKDMLNNGHIVDIVSQTLQMNLHNKVHIYLAQKPDDYKNVLASLGVSLDDAQRFSRDTGGFTADDNVVIPLYQNKTQPELANTLGHELTHAFLNQEAGNVPSWINEGTAVFTGMRVQASTQDPVAYAGYARQMAESVLDAVTSKKLIPLTEDESKVLQGSTSYDLELQDWLALSTLVHQYGYGSLSDYFSRLKAGGNTETAFMQSFGNQHTAVFNEDFTKSLQQAAQSPDSGLSLQLSVSGDYAGYIRVLQHGSQDWQGFGAKSGDTVITIDPNGKLHGDVGTVDDTHDRSPADETTTYVDLDPDTDLYYKGKQVQYCGFAVDYHNGLYGFVNAWVTFKDRKTEYVDNPTLFGVKVTKLTEAAQVPFTRLLSAP